MLSFVNYRFYITFYQTTDHMIKIPRFSVEICKKDTDDLQRRNLHTVSYKFCFRFLFRNLRNLQISPNSVNTCENGPKLDLQFG